MDVEMEVLYAVFYMYEIESRRTASTVYVQFAPRPGIGCCMPAYFPTHFFCD